MTFDPAPTSTCPNVFLPGLASIADQPRNPAQAHRVPARARKRAKGAHRAKARHREPYRWLGAGRSPWEWVLRWPAGRG